MNRTGLRYLPKAFLASLDRPFLIWMAPPVLCLFAASGILFALIATWSGPEIDLSISIDQNPNSSLSLAELYILVSLSAAVNFVSAFGFSREKHWAREGFIVGSTVCLLYLLVTSLLKGASVLSVVFGMSQGLIALLVESWYLFRYRPVHAYYERIGSRDAL